VSQPRVTEANLINVDVTQRFLKCQEGAEHLRHARLINMFSPPVPISDDTKEKKVTSAAKAQTLTGRRVLTGTPPSVVMVIVPRVAPLEGERRGRRAVPHFSRVASHRNVSTDRQSTELV
jgi:hypothetical protein